MKHDITAMRFYHIHDKDNGNAIVGTVCLVKGNAMNKYTWSRGISICSMDDRFEKRKGRAIALARARRANGTWKDSDPILVPFKRNWNVRDAARRFKTAAQKYYGLYSVAKSAYNVVPTEYENSMLED